MCGRTCVTHVWEQFADSCFPEPNDDAQACCSSLVFPSPALLVEYSDLPGSKASFLIRDILGYSCWAGDVLSMPCSLQWSLAEARSEIEDEKCEVADPGTTSTTYNYSTERAAQAWPFNRLYATVLFRNEMKLFSQGETKSTQRAHKDASVDRVLCLLGFFLGVSGQSSGWPTVSACSACKAGRVECPQQDCHLINMVNNNSTSAFPS